MQLTKLSKRKLQSLVQDAILVGGSIKFEGDNRIPLNDVEINVDDSDKHLKGNAKEFAKNHLELFFTTRDYYNGEYTLVDSQLFISHMTELSEEDQGGFDTVSREDVTPPYLYFEGNLIIDTRLSTQTSATLCKEVKLVLVHLYNSVGDEVSLTFKLPNYEGDTDGQWLLELMQADEPMNRSDLRKLVPFLNSKAINYVRGFYTQVVQPQSKEVILSSRTVQTVTDIMATSKELIIETESTKSTIKWDSIKQVRAVLSATVNDVIDLEVYTKNNTKMVISLSQWI